MKRTQNTARVKLLIDLVVLVAIAISCVGTIVSATYAPLWLAETFCAVGVAALAVYFISDVAL
jgi:hypothetical protein